MKKLMLGLMMAFAANAEAEVVNTYDLTDSLKAELDSEGILTVIGSGAMPNWSRKDEQVWKNERTQIKSVVVDGDVTIGSFAFENCSSLTNATLPNVTLIGVYAFSNCSSLGSVLVQNATAIGEYAFY